MYIDFKKIFSFLLILAIGTGLGVGGVKLIDRYQTPKQTASVVGTGEMDAATDQATVDIQIKTTSSTFEKAQEENKKDVEKLKSDLTKLGIPESRITTSSYSSPNLFNESPSIDYMEGKMMPIRPNTTPTVTTNLTVVLDPIKNIEKVYDTVSKNTNAQVVNSYYSLKNRKTWEAKAKEEALKDARSQIESIAKINHLRVGRLLSLEDANNPDLYPMPIKELNLNDGANDGTTMEAQSSSPSEEASQTKTDNTYYSEQTVKITSSYTATYELY